MVKRVKGASAAGRLLVAGVPTLALLLPCAAESADATLSPQVLAMLPAVTLDVSFATGKGPVHARFAGPLLWAVLVKDGAVDPGKPRRQAGQTILVTGQDGYAAALAVGEISPDFEGKSVILAESMNAQPLGSSHLRLVIPGDAKGARDVRNVVRVTVSDPAAGPR
jgi:hypothetical protein